jgi:hypothetical protein
MSIDDALRELRTADELSASGETDAGGAARERAHGLLHELHLTTAVYDGDAAAWHFGHAAPGPAGAATLRLARGASLTVDLADPSQLLGLTVPIGGGAAADAGALAGVLIGPDAAAMLAATAEPGSTALVAHSAARGPSLRALSRLAVLDCARRLDEDEHGAWPLWAAEAAVLYGRAAGVAGCDIRARAEAATCVDAVVAVAQAPRAGAAHARLAELLAELGGLAASASDRALLERELSKLSPDAVARGGDWRERVRRLLAALAGGAVAPLPNMIWTAATRSPPRSGQPPARRQPSATFPVPRDVTRYGLTTRRARVFWVEGSAELEVQCHTAPDGAERVGELWVRAFTPPDFAFLDSAPLAMEAGEAPDDDGRPFATARLVLPLGLAHDLLRLDITAQPAEPPAESQLGLCRRAKRNGVAALAAERAGLHAEAAERWTESAALWQRAGAELQRSIAEIFAAQALDRVPGRDGDALRAELQLRGTASAWRLRGEREPQPPFLGELARPDDIAAAG